MLMCRPFTLLRCHIACCQVAQGSGYLDNLYMNTLTSLH